MSGEQLRNPELFNITRLLAQDFDRTIALTDERMLGCVTVEEAYEHAVDEVFGYRSLRQYRESGGLLNRAPLEVTRQLAPDAVTDAEVNELTDKLNASKLKILTEQIGLPIWGANTVWPRLAPGYVQALEAVDNARADGWLIDDMVISSGHEAFIRKTFKVHGLPQPSLVLAEETVRAMKLDVTPDELVKPSPLLMKLGVLQWRKLYGDDRETDITVGEMRRMVYVGDDPAKDGEFARLSGVPFIEIKSEDYEASWRNVIEHLQIATYAGKVACE